MKTNTTYKLTVQGKTIATCRYSKREQAWTIKHGETKTVHKLSEIEKDWEAFKAANKPEKEAKAPKPKAKKAAKPRKAKKVIDVTFEVVPTQAAIGFWPESMQASPSRHTVHAAA